MVKAQGYLNQHYSPFIRKNIKMLNISNLNLEGELDLKDFESLETLYCSYNSITKIVSLENTKLKELHCCNNQIIELDLDFLSNLETVDCSNNQLDYSDLDLIKRKFLKLTKQKNQELQKKNQLLKERVNKTSQKLDELLKIMSMPSVEKKTNIKNNAARKEIKIIQPEPDEKQVELEIVIDNSFDNQEKVLSPTTQSALKRLKALKENYDGIQTFKQDTKQSRRQFQILVPPKK